MVPSPLRRVESPPVPPVTLVLILANVAFFLLQTSVASFGLPFALWPIGASDMSGGRVSFAPWQLVTYSFLHGDMLHLAFNMFAVWMFGGAIERTFGARWYVIYYFTCVIAAGIAQLLFAQFTGGLYPTVGASGGVFGLLLAYAVYFPQAKLMMLFLPIPIPARVFVVIYAAMELYLGVSGTQSGVAHFAHLGGLVGGALLLWSWGAFRRR
jgi:membrane associated rhomboid family serine protease